MRLLLTLFFFLSITGSALSAGKLVLATVPNFPPFVIEENDSHTGIDIDILKQVATETGMEIDFRFLPWARGIQYIKQGKIDGLFSGFKTAEREAFADFVTPGLHYATYNILTLSGYEFPFATIRDLKGKSFALNLGWKISPAFDQAVADNRIRVEWVPTTPAGLEMLAAGRVDGIVGNSDVIHYWTRHMNKPVHLAVLPNALTAKTHAYLMLSKNSDIPNRKSVIQKLGQSVQKIHDSGLSRSIARKYGTPSM